MSTSVEVTDRTKSRLEELQAEIRLETGPKVTRQEVLERLTEPNESKAKLIDSFRHEYEPPSEDEIDRRLSGTSDWGVETTEREIDDVLYGD